MIRSVKIHFDLCYLRSIQPSLELKKDLTSLEKRDLLALINRGYFVTN